METFWVLCGNIYGNLNFSALPQTFQSKLKFAPFNFGLNGSLIVPESKYCIHYTYLSCLTMLTDMLKIAILVHFLSHILEDLPWKKCVREGIQYTELLNL